jgi:hypothetical protein
MQQMHAHRLDKLPAIVHRLARAGKQGAELGLMRGKARFAFVIGRHQPLAKGGKVGQHHRVEIVKRLRQAQAWVGEHGVLGGGAHLGFVVHGAAQGKKLTFSQRFGTV